MDGRIMTGTCLRWLTQRTLHARSPTILGRRTFASPSSVLSAAQSYPARAHQHGPKRFADRKAEQDDEILAKMEEHPELKYDSQGRIVLFRGPPAMKTWIYYLVGGTFFVIGMEVAYNFYNHLTWPLWGKNAEDGGAHLADRWKRVAASGFAGSIGAVTALLFFMVPSASVTRVSLDLPARHLVIRTAARGFSALLPRQIYPRPFRTLAERKGFYCTPKNNERVVPLAQVFRIKGSAVASGIQPTIVLRQSGRSREAQIESIRQRQRNLTVESSKRSIEIKTGDDRFWYTVEAAGSGVPNKNDGRTTYSRFFQRVSYSMRGKTDWSDVADPPTTHGQSSSTYVDPKQPWFLSRRTFDDVIPLVKRK